MYQLVLDTNVHSAWADGRLSLEEEQALVDVCKQRVANLMIPLLCAEWHWPPEKVARWVHKVGEAGAALLFVAEDPAERELQNGLRELRGQPKEPLNIRRVTAVEMQWAINNSKVRFAMQMTRRATEMMARAAKESRDLMTLPGLTKQAAIARKSQAEQAGLEVLKDPAGLKAVTEHLDSEEFREQVRAAAKQMGFELPDDFQLPRSNLDELIQSSLQATNPETLAELVSGLDLALSLPGITNEELSALTLRVQTSASDYPAFYIKNGITKALQVQTKRKIHPSDWVDLSTLTTAPYVDYLTTDAEMADHFSRLSIVNCRGRVFRRSELFKMLTEMKNR